MRAAPPPSTTAALSSARSSAVSESLPSAWPAATIAVTGVRRSWETARSSAVLTSSLRRRAARLDRFGLQRVAAQGDRDERSERGHDVASCSRCSVSTGRSRGTSSVATWEPSAPLKRKRAAPLLAGRDAELDRRGGHRERLGDPVRGDRQRIRGLRAGQQLSRERRREVGLGPAALGLERAAARELGHRADRDRDDHESSERDPVAAVGDREAPGRGEVEEVERGGAQQRRGEAERQPPVRGHEQHRGQVHHAQRDDRSERS